MLKIGDNVLVIKPCDSIYLGLKGTIVGVDIDRHQSSTENRWTVRCGIRNLYFRDAALQKVNSQLVFSFVET